MRLYNRPQIAKRMVAFIPQADKMNEEGFNALLKTMEEPHLRALIKEDLKLHPRSKISEIHKAHLIRKHELKVFTESRFPDYCLIT